MTIIRSTTALSLAVLFILWGGVSPGLGAENEKHVDFTGEREKIMVSHEYPSWLVVDLFTGGSASKQSVKVHDAFVRLGAEGKSSILSFRKVTIQEVIDRRPAFIVLSPNGIPWCRYRGQNGEKLKDFFRSLKVIVEEMNVPVIGICGGHQALALAFGGKVGPILGGEDDCFPYGKNPIEKGRHDLDIVRDDPLFKGLGKTINLVQSHTDEVKRLPKGFICLAKNELCPYQIIRHPSRPAYGVQAHTEYFHSRRPDGGILLENFLRIAREHNRAGRTAISHSSGATPAEIFISSFEKMRRSSQEDFRRFPLGFSKSWMRMQRKRQVFCKSPHFHSQDAFGYERFGITSNYP
jgi:GMP synthase (glutamine-hydrolysing)